MSSRLVPLHLLGSSLAVVLFAGRARAQSTDTSCRNTSESSWMFNSQGESPCVVWSKLQALCLPSSQYINIPPLIDSSYAYNAPGEQGTICQCNVVAYNLMAACIHCQLGTSASYISEEAWSAGCPEYNNTSISFAQTVLPLPAYAFTPWNGSYWAPAQAQAVGIVTAAPTVASLTLSRAFSTTSHSSSVSATSSASTVTPEPGPINAGTTAGESSKSKLQKYGPIIGGVAGAGVVLLIIILILIRWYRTRPSRDPHNSSSESDPMAKAQRKGISILDRFSLSARNSKIRQQELWNSKEAFSDPRPAPNPLAYVTTQQRLRANPHASSSFGSSSTDGSSSSSSATSSSALGIRRDGKRHSDDSDIPRGLPDLRHWPDPPNTGRTARWKSLDAEASSAFAPGGLNVADHQDTSRSSTSTPSFDRHDKVAYAPAPAPAPYVPILPSQRAALTRAAAAGGDLPPPSIDFSIAPSPEPYHPRQDISRSHLARDRREEESVLPSLYEPRTGAPTFLVPDGHGRISPESRYQPTERPTSSHTFASERVPQRGGVGRVSVPDLPVAR